MRTIYTDRSRTEQYQRCPRSRYLGYHQDGLGITSAKKPLPLAVGGSVHKGLEHLLLHAPALTANFDGNIHGIEDRAVEIALEDFTLHRGALESDALPSASPIPADPSATVTSLTASTYEDQLAAQAADLGMDVSQLQALTGRVQSGAKDYDDYLWTEQSSLVEGMVRAYARRRLRPLLEEYEVLEVEREGEWELASGGTLIDIDSTGRYEDHDGDWTLRFMSRPDALLRSRSDNSLYLLSFKTAASWDHRKEKDAQHDMQGLSEGVEVERRLSDWWAKIHGVGLYGAHENTLPDESCSSATYEFLHDLPAPPRILGIRMEYLLKGERWKDATLSARYGFEVRVQKSPLVRCYVATSTPKRGVSDYAIGDRCCSWEFLRDDGSESKLAYQNWKSRTLIEEGISISQWIAMLDDSQPTMSAEDSTVGLDPRALGWKSAAQSVGYLPAHPLDALFVPPIIVYRQSDELLDWIEQVEAQEVRVAKGVARVESAPDEGERRSALNQEFPMARRACQYPSQCAFVSLCFGGEDARRDPLSNGFRRREPHHEPERAAVGSAVEKE